MASTIKDIAKQLGVSVSTVSYALNGGPRPVRQDVKDRVLAAAKAMDYRPNLVARSLITRRTFTIGVVPSVVTTHLTRIPYYAGCLGGIVDEAEALGQDVLLFTRYDQSNTVPFVNTLLDGRADGLIFLAPSLTNPVLEQIQGRIPFVVASGLEVEGSPSVSCDNRGGVRMAIQHLYELGHRRIANVHGRLTMVDGLERRDAFNDSIAEFGLESRPEWTVDGDFSPMGGFDAGQLLFSLEQRPTAVFCANDETAAGLIKAAFLSGLRVPQDVSVIGFDDAPYAALSYPALTTIRQPLEDLGAHAIRAVVSLIEGEATIDHQQFPTDLIVRETTHRPMEDHTHA